MPPEIHRFKSHRHEKETNIHAPATRITFSARSGFGGLRPWKQLHQHSGRSRTKSQGQSRQKCSCLCIPASCSIRLLNEPYSAFLLKDRTSSPVGWWQNKNREHVLRDNTVAPAKHRCVFVFASARDINFGGRSSRAQQSTNRSRG